MKPKISRQAKSIARIRAARRAAGKCFECGARAKTFRCAACNAARRGAMKILMRARRA